MRTATRLVPALLLAGLVAPASAAEVPFETAAGLVMEQGLEVEAARVTLDGARSLARHAGGLPGPSIAADVENFGPDRNGRDIESPQVTVAVSQPLMIGPRASAQRSLARAGTLLAAAQLDAAARAQLATLTRLYAATAASGLRVDVATGRLRLADDLAANARRRLAAGDVAEVEAKRVEVEAALAAAAAQAARLEAVAASATLARFIGRDGATAAPGWLAAVSALPAEVPAEAPAADQPLWDAERAVAARAQAAARAERLPTADLTLGARRFSDAQATAAVAGVTLALPLWNGNRGAIDRAAANAKRADLEAAMKARDTRARRTDALAALHSATGRLRSIERSALPAARRALELSERGYAAGALPYRDLADASRTLIEIEESKVAAMVAIAEARATLVELSGDVALIGLAERAPAGGVHPAGR